MRKVVVDLELLERLRNFTFLHDDGCAGALRGGIDRAIAQPAEAEGVERWSKLARLAEKATPGPWVSFCKPSVQAVFGPNGVQPDSAGTIVNWPGFDSSDATMAKRKANANFIAAANPVAVLELIAAISAVTAERDAANSRLHEVAESCATAEQERDQLRAEVEGLAKDAERYRWLRGRLPGSAYRIAGVIYSEGGDGVDAAINAALAAKEA
ncbi:ead/Ea22-like family protein [Stutzerimonas degradans]